MKLCLRWIVVVAVVAPLAALAQQGFDQNPPQSRPAQPATRDAATLSGASATVPSGGYTLMSLQGNKLPQQDSDYAQSAPELRRNSMPSDDQKIPAGHGQDGQSPSTNTR